MSSGIRAASSPDLETASGAHSAAGRITPGLKMRLRVEGRLQLPEEAHHLVAVEPLERTGAEPAVAMLAGRRAAEAHEESCTSS